MLLLQSPPPPSVVGLDDVKLRGDMKLGKVSEGTFADCGRDNCNFFTRPLREALCDALNSLAEPALACGRLGEGAAALRVVVEGIPDPRSPGRAFRL